jgi:hypothetical protein
MSREYRSGRRSEAEIEQMRDVERKNSRHVHVKRKLVLRIKVSIGKISIHLGVGS